MSGLVAHRVSVPLLRPHRWARGEATRRESILLALDRGDHIGWSECATLASSGYATETTDQAWAALTGSAGAELGIAARSALADVVLDAELRSVGRSLVSYLGATRRRLDRCTVLAGIGADPDELVERALAAFGSGAAMVKVKVSPATDPDSIARVVDTASRPGGADGNQPARSVAVDANGSFADPDEISAFDSLGLRYIEQPFDAGMSFDDLAAMHRVLRTPVALDESLIDAAAVDAAIEARAARVLSLKPLRMGGVVAAAESAGRAAAAGIDCFVGGMFELGIGRAAAAAVAALEACSIPTDLGPSSAYVRHDICEAITVDDAGRLVVPTGPGCGRDVDPADLGAYLVDRVEVPIAILDGGTGS